MEQGVAEEPGSRVFSFTQDLLPQGASGSTGPALALLKIPALYESRYTNLCQNNNLSLNL